MSSDILSSLDISSDISFDIFFDIFLTYLLTFLLTFFFWHISDTSCDISSGGWGPVLPTPLLRSGAAHCNLEVHVDIWRHLAWRRGRRGCLQSRGVRGRRRRSKEGRTLHIKSKNFTDRWGKRLGNEMGGKGPAKKNGMIFCKTQQSEIRRKMKTKIGFESVNFTMRNRMGEETVSLWWYYPFSPLSTAFPYFISHFFFSCRPCIPSKNYCCPIILTPFFHNFSFSQYLYAFAFILMIYIFFF